MILGVTLGLLTLSGCSSESGEQKEAPFGSEWKARQASYESECIAKGHTAVACEQTNPASDYTSEYRQSVMAYRALITQCLDNAVEACRLIVDEDVGHCGTFATEVISPSDPTHLADSRARLSPTPTLALAAA